MSLLVIVVHYTRDKQISRNSCLCAHRMPARNELTRSATLQKQTPGVCSLFTGPQLVFKRLKWLFTSCGGVVVTATSFFHRHLWRNRRQKQPRVKRKLVFIIIYDGCGGAPEESLTSGCLTAFHSYNESVGRELSEAVDLKKITQKTHPGICGLFLINYSSPINQLNLA